ncbi:MAG: hypothetical protein ACE37D_01715 [Pseudomonadales bacterium]
MSTVWLSALVGAGLFVLVLIAWGAHRLEMAKIERLRLSGLHKDRFRNLQFILEVSPPKAFKGDLPVLLTRSMVLHMEKVIELQGESSALLGQLEYAKGLQQKVAKGESIASKSSGGTLNERLKDVRRAMRLLKEFILQQHRAGFLSKAVASQHIKSLQEINIVATVDGLLSQASHSQGEGSKATALRYYQLALGEIRKCKNKALLAEQQEFVTKAIVALKADQKAIAETTQRINKEIADSVSPDKDDPEDDFDMRQIN